MSIYRTIIDKSKNFFVRLTKKKTNKKLKYQSVLIVTYGRTGSTLLQGLLNSINGCLVRGENNQFCYDLFLAYNHIVDVKKKIAPDSTNPFFGAHLLDEQIIIKHSQDMIKELLIADKKGEDIVCYGFKEVRYINVLDDLFEYLDFLKMVFPNVAFVFNTRIVEDASKSAWWVERDPDETKNNMKRCGELFNEYVNKNSNGFLMTYEDMAGKSKKIRELFDFLGAEYSDETISRVLATPHSYKMPAVS